MEPNNDLYAGALEVQSFLEAAGLPHCLIGGVAVLRWGNPRQTTDFDLCVLTGWDGTDEVIDKLCGRFPARIPDAVEFARRNRVLLLRAPTLSIFFDVTLGALPFEEEMIHRSSLFEFAPDLMLRTCSAEDLVIMKCFAGRAIDLMDVTGILQRQQGLLDLNHVRRWLQEIQDAIERTDLLGTFERLLSEIHSR